MRRSKVLQAVGAAVLAAVVIAPSARAEDPRFEIEWVTVGDPGNLPDTEVMAADRTTAYGSVPYTYEIGKFLITNEQYAAFLNAVASKSDPYLLYHPLLDNNAGYNAGSGIGRAGEMGNYRYFAQPGRERRPVNYINLFDALRFTNWVNNGQGHSSTEDGAYTLRGGGLIPTNALTITRNPDAKIALSSEDEWYKAAYYDPAKHVYYDSPNGTDEPMTCAMPGPTPNTGNCELVTAKVNPDNPGVTGVASWFWADTSDVGAYTTSTSPVGAYDMGGNLFQWTDTISFAVVGQYHAGSRIAPALDAVNSVIGNPFKDGLGPVGVLRGTDYGDGGEFAAANGRTNDFSFYKWETYGMRLVRLRP